MTSVQTIFDYVMANPEGFSIGPDGVTVPVDGYMVAQAGHEAIVAAGAVEAIMAYIVEYVASGTTAYMGGWVHEGSFYMDRSDNIADYRHAVIAGRQRNQIAIWDVANRREIVV